MNQAYVNGEIDYDFDVTVDPTDYKQVKGATNGHVTLAAGPDFRQFTINGGRGFLTDEKVRQAIDGGHQPHRDHQVRPHGHPVAGRAAGQPLLHEQPGRLPGQHG